MARRDITGAVDFDHLAIFCAGDTALMEEVIGLFLEQADLWGRLLDPDGDGEAWRDGAHSLKGSALGIGAGELGQVCGEAEASWREPAAMRGAIRFRLDSALDRVRADIAAWRHEILLRALK
jgi:HPt (histidine-containing phosphotransfer) domain-containing protein